MNKGLCLALAVGGLTLAGCGNNRGPLATTPASSTPTDFTSFVSSQLQTHPQFGATPTPTTTLSQDQQLGNPGAYAGLNFAGGDALPAGTNQASVACAQAGKTACNPGVSADLNSDLD
jgi:predicted small lipoprotein YifL